LAKSTIPDLSVTLRMARWILGIQILFKKVEEDTLTGAGKGVQTRMVCGY
jgi:hypothetical protein